MNVDSPLWQMVRRIRHAQLSSMEHELFRPVFAAYDLGHVIHVPELVIARMRHVDARTPKSK